MGEGVHNCRRALHSFMECVHAPAAQLQQRRMREIMGGGMMVAHEHMAAPCIVRLRIKEGCSSGMVRVGKS